MKNVKISDMFVCTKVDCFACENGMCTLLTERIRPCPFFKTKKDFVDDIQKSYEKLSEEGKSELVEKYVLNRYGITKNIIKIKVGEVIG